MPRFEAWLVIVLVGCAQPPPLERKPTPETPAELPPLPATYVNTPGCPRLSATRAAENLKSEFVKNRASPVLVSLDAQFEGAPAMLRVLRPATLLNSHSCPS